MDVHHNKLDVHTSMGPLFYKVVDRMDALGGILWPATPTVELIAHRLDKAENCFWKFQKPFPGKACVSLKLRAYCVMSCATASFLEPVAHWLSTLLRDGLRWER